MNTHNIELPPLPVPRTKTDGGIELFAEYSVREYARAAIEPYKQRIEELEAELQELQRQWVEHDTLGCPTAKTGIYASKADRKTYNPIGEGTIQQLHDVLLYLQNETMKLEAAYGSNFKKEATEKARAATEKMNEAVYAIKNIDRQRRGEPVAWLYEDELPDNYPYDTMFPYSKVDGVRMFPVYAPQPAEPQVVDHGGPRADKGFAEENNLVSSHLSTMVEPVKVPSSFPTGTEYSVEPHGNGYAIYQGRDQFHHGLNLAHLTECTPEFAKRIESALNTMYEPEGWQLVPKEPTEEMLAATSWPNCAGTDYKHMLEAAPKFGEEE